MSLSYRTERIGNVLTIGNGRRGGKGHNIHNAALFLERHNDARIPKTTIITHDLASGFGVDISQISTFVSQLGLKPGFMAVRSSALSEDGSCSCAGVFDTLFVRHVNGDLIPVSLAIKDVLGSAAASSAFIERRGLEPGMAIILQSAVGGRISDTYFGPMFSGVLDTSSINGTGTMTISVALGLGTCAVNGNHDSNIAVVKRGHFSENDRQVMIRQKNGELLSSATGKKEVVGIEKMLSLFSFDSTSQAVRYFLQHYLVPIYRLSKRLEEYFDHSPVDIEFAISPTKGMKLYLLQARLSHMKRIKNPNYPTNIRDEQVICISRTVLGARTVETETIANYNSADYLRDAQAGFKSLLRLDQSGKPYILIVPPEATSSDHPALPLKSLNNLVFVAERLTTEQIHVPGVNGVDHFSRLASESEIGYIEGSFNYERLAQNSRRDHPDHSPGDLTVYTGKFGAAVCSLTNRGVIYLRD